MCILHAGPTKSCKKDSRFPHAVYKVEEATSGENLNKILQKNRTSPRSRSRCRSSKRFLTYHWRLHTSDHVAPRTKLNVPKDDFPIPSELYRCSETHKNKSLSDSWICVTRFELLKNNFQKDIFGFTRRTDKRNRILQDLEISDRTNAQACQKNFQRRAIKKWTEEEPKSDAREQRGF